MRSTLTLFFRFCLQGAKLSLFRETSKYFARKIAILLTFLHFRPCRVHFSYPQGLHRCLNRCLSTHRALGYRRCSVAPDRRQKPHTQSRYSGRYRAAVPSAGRGQCSCWASVDRRHRCVHRSVGPPDGGIRCWCNCRTDEGRLL